MNEIPAPHDQEQRIKVIEETSKDAGHLQPTPVNSEMNLFCLTENDADIIYATDASGRFTHFNAAAEKLTGYAEADLIGKPVSDIIHPDFRAEVQRFYSEQSVNKRLVTYFELPLLAGDQRELWLAQHVHLITENKRVKGFHAIGRNITKRKQIERSEKIFASAFHLNPDPIAITDMDTGKMLNANLAFARWTGFSPEEFIGSSTTDLNIWVDSEERQSIISRLTSVGKVQSRDVKMRQRNGNIRDVNCSARMIEIERKRYLLTVVHDITERRQAEEALKESKELYSKLVDTIPDVVVQTDTEDRVLFVNDYALRTGGYTRDEVEGRKVVMFVSPADRNRFSQNRLLMMTSSPEPKEYKLLRKDGREVPFEVNGDVLRSGDGTPSGFVFVCRDLSASKRSEEALLESEEKYRQIFEGATEGIFQTTLEGRYIRMNPAVASLFGYASPREMMEAVTDIGGQLFVNRQDREAMARILHEQNRVDGWEVEVYRKDGNRVWISQNIHTVRDASGNVLYFEGTCRDITERKQAEEQSRRSEEKFHKIFMTSPEMITISRLEDGFIADVNLGFEEITGWKREEVIGRTSYDLNFWINPSDRKHMVEELKAGRDIVHCEIPFRHKDGSLRTGIYSARMIQMTDEFSLIFVLQDISDRKRLDEERQKLEQQLFQSQKMDAIGQLAGGVAHDFNNMLGVIIGNAEMALDKVDPSDPLHKMLQGILSAGMRSADLTRQLLAFARKQAVNPKVLDLNDTVAGTLKMLQRLIGENIKLVWIPGQKLWRIRIDPSQVDQLLANLAVNARDAITKAGQIVIETSNTICDGAYRVSHPECIPGEYVILAVSDNGSGMEKETLASIFEPFFTTKKEGEGTGLGLATVYGIVRQNGGFINVYSEPGLGTTFRIYLPRFHVPDTDDAEEKPAAKIQGGTETILIVEDEEWVLNLSKEMLETLGYTVMAARRTEEAFRLAGAYSGKIDLLLTDVVMPDMNGKELSERITAIKPGIKCLYMSGYTADIISRQGVLDEGIQFIQKPFSLSDLSAKVREALDS